MLGLVFPHQLFADIPSHWKTLHVIRHDIGYGGKHTTVKQFHIARKVFLRAAEHAFVEYARSKGYTVRVFGRKDTWYTKEDAEAWDPVDHMLEAELKRKCPHTTILPTPGFLLTAEDARTLLGDSEHDSHSGFYGKMRSHFDILMTKQGTPEGGKLRYDIENRLSIGPDVKLPNWEKELEQRQSKFVAAAYKEIVAEEGKTASALGDWSTGQLVFPTTHEGARKALKRFVQERLKNFGPYEDAIVAHTSGTSSDFLFHSVLSGPTNAGLLTPAEILDELLTYKGKVPIASLEGCIAQILGWREYMRAVYLKRPVPPRNRLRHGKSLSSAWYEGTTGLLPVDVAIRRVRTHAYAHHIERLMVLGNAMFLCQIRPDDVYAWFMEMFADSYDWVMIGNVYYMSQWCSDAITTKPYISSSAYIRRMSDYPGGDWTKAWDALYWNTVRRLAPLIRKNYRMAAQVSFWERMDDEKQKEIVKTATSFLRSI